MAPQPNILFLMADQMQARILDPGHVCSTPNFNRLMEQGVRFEHAYTSNAICSPARAGIMTGLLPHSHGVVTVTHLTDNDQCNLRTEYPHWAQRMSDAGYKTGYFGKWHIERTNDLAQFGWQVDCGWSGEHMKEKIKDAHAYRHAEDYKLAKYYSTPGYNESIFYGVTDIGPEKRPMGIITEEALSFIEKGSRDKPWCCFVSVPEPHDPFITGAETFSQYNPDEIELPVNVHDELGGRPGIYRKAAQVWNNMTDSEHREAAACYYASITEIDQQFGRLIDAIEQTDQIDNTLIILTADHGELLGAHGLYCKNFSASEEVYNIPLVISGPGIPAGITTSARVGSHDLCPTICELTGCASIDHPDSSSFASVLEDPLGREQEFKQGFAEYHGGRYNLTQRIAWDGPWKFVLNGFDFDELYNLEEDPFEMNNLVNDPQYTKTVKEMMAYIWTRIRDTGDHSLLNSHYPILRVAPFGPGIIEEEKKD